MGLISGGVAGNVFAPAAEATLFWRLAGESGPARRRLDAIVAADDSLSWELVGQNDAVVCRTLPGFRGRARCPFPRTSPSCRPGGRPLLIGPGSIHVAHSATERVLKSELVDAVGYYRRIAETLLG